MSASDNHRDPVETFSAWLDAITSGQSTPGGRIDADLEDMQAATRQFHGLDDAARQHVLAIRSKPTSWEDIMSTTHATLPIAAISPGRARNHRTGPSLTYPPRAWMSAALIAILLAGMTLGFGSLLGRFGDDAAPPPEDTTIPFAGLANDDLAGDATPVPMGESSSIPYPNAANCTIEPMTRDEVVAHLEAANVATEPVYAYYEQAIVPSEEDAQGIMETFRMWKACQLNGRAMAYSMSLETPWFTASTAPLFHAPGWTDSDETFEERLQRFADIAVLNEDELDLLYPPATPTDQEMEEWASTKEAINPPPTTVPIPAGATPVDQPSGGYMPTIFPENIELIGPDLARATVVSVNQESGEILPGVVLYYDFVKVDGEWLLEDYREPDNEGRG